MKNATQSITATECPLLTFRPSDLKTRLEKMRPFMSTDVIRHYLCSIYIQFSKGTLTLVALNGHILCEMVMHLGTKGRDFSAICPARAVDTLIAMLDEDDAEASLQLLNGKLHFKTAHSELVVKPIDHDYPDYLKVIPTDKPIAKHGFAADYLLSILAALDNQPVDISIGDKSNHVPAEPHLFVSDKAQGIRCVAMPKLIQNP